MAFPDDDPRHATEYQTTPGKKGDMDWVATKAVAVTPDDTATLSPLYPRALYIGTGGSGNLTVDTAEGDVDVLFKVQSCQLLPVRVKRVKATGTDCSDIVALY